MLTQRKAFQIVKRMHIQLSKKSIRRRTEQLWCRKLAKYYNVPLWTDRSSIRKLFMYVDLFPNEPV